MRFILTDEQWVLDALSSSEWHLVCELPRTAAGEGFSERTKERLFPSPLSEDTLADDDTLSQIEDWDRFVRPDLDEGFKEVRELVRNDLNRVETFPADTLLDPGQIEPGHGDLLELRRLEVPIEHTEAWYSVLNQARLLMNEEHDLAEEEDRLMIQLEGPDAVDQDRLLVLAQYEMYSVIQSILVENVMDR
ncbi:MAG: hypothetical protein WD342_14800 [Verrucomicrobiales bacterium]